MPRRKAKTSSLTITGYIRVITNVITFGFTAAASGTVSLATSAAKATTDLAVQPFNTLFKATKETYFAPQVTYPDRSWSGIVESFSARKRAWTGESKKLERPRSGSVATFHHVTGGPLAFAPPPRSTSVPAHLAHAQDLSIAIRRQRRPELRPLDIPGASLHAHPRGPNSPLSSPLLTPSIGHSPSSYSSSHGSLPSTPRSAPLSASTPVSPQAKQPKMSAKGKFGGLEIARVSFWNLVGLGEDGLENVAEDSKVANCGSMQKTAIVVSCEEDDEEGGEDYIPADREPLC